MTDSGQRSLEDFGAQDDRRPVEAEAAAVAGNGSGTGSDIIDPERETLPPADGEISIAVMQVDYTIVGDGDTEQPIIHVFGRTDNGDIEHVRVRGFRPYFYAPAANVDEAKLTTYDRITGWEETDDNNEPYQSIRGTELVRIYGQTPRDVGQIRDEFEHYEADILFPDRFLIDKNIKKGLTVPERRDQTGTLVVHHDEVTPAAVTADPRVCFLDIEVDDRRGFPEDGEEPIVCLTTHDSYTDTYIGWLYEAPEGTTQPPEGLSEYDPLQPNTDIEIRTYESEDAMLEALIEYLQLTDPDLLSGWNFTDFDAPYLLDRLEVLDRQSDRNLGIDQLSRVNEVWRSDWGGPDIKGRVVFDLLYAYQRTKFTELDSYRLDDVGERELGVGKERYPGDLGDLWEDDPEQLLEYNLRDVELCVELNRTQDIIPFWNEVRSFVGCRLEDATTPGDAVDMYVLQKTHGEFALPSKGQQESEDYEGGAVFDPITGVRENVSVLDLKCFSGDTDVLTPEGPKNIQELDVGDPVYTLNPDTFACEVKPVSETHEYENQFGELHHLSGNTHDFKVTENHRFLVSSGRGQDDQTPEDFEFEEYRNISDWEQFVFPQHEPMDGRHPDQFSLVDEVDQGSVVLSSEDDLRRFRDRMPDAVTEALTLVHGSSSALGLQSKAGKCLVPVDIYREHRTVINEHADEVFLKYGRQHSDTPISFEMEDWLTFLGWFVTKGSTDSANGRLTLHQSNDSGRETICDLVERLGLQFNTDDRGVNISNAFLVDWLEANCGEGRADKQLPEWVFDLDGELLQTLLDTMIRENGSRADSGLGELWTKSDQLKDDIVDLAVRCGQKPTVSREPDETWCISIGKQGSFKKSTNATVEDHDGTVYCITAQDNHVVLAGRNGHYQWVGQSLYPMCMVTTNASPETKVDPEGYAGETYHAPNGTHFRKSPDGIIREMVDELLTEREKKKSRRNEHDPEEPEYEQYNRQQQAVKVIMNCFTSDTEVLTPAGIRNIRELEIGDKVYSLDPDTMELEIKRVTDTHAYPEYRGELVDIQTSSIDFQVTPNHRMLVRKNDPNDLTKKEWDFVEAGELDEHSRYEMPHSWEFDHGDSLKKVDITRLIDTKYEVWVRPSVHENAFTDELGWKPQTVLNTDPNVEGYVFSSEEFEQHREYIESVCEQSFVRGEPDQEWIPRTYDTNHVLELIGWYITEGTIDIVSTEQFGKNSRNSSTAMKIVQENPTVADGGDTHQDQIGALLEEMGLEYVKHNRCYQFTSQLFGEFLRESCGEDSFTKRIPEFVFDLSKSQKQRFLETLVSNNGRRQPDSWQYTTASENLRDDVLRLCVHMGLSASYDDNGNSWRIYGSEETTNSFRIHQDGNRKEAEDGVYCVTVEDNHTLLAGRNGKFQHVGQSLYGVLGWDRFRLYDREMGAAVTATGREVIEFTEEVSNELGKQVVYGDSVTGDRPIVVQDPEGVFRILPIEELFEQASVDGKTTLHQLDNGNVTVDANPKEYASLEGWKALSLSDNGEAEWQPIQSVIRHKTSKDVLKMQHRIGESTTTRDHSYVIEDNGKYQTAPPESVDKPVRIPSVPSVNNQQTIDVYEVLNRSRGKDRDSRGGPSGKTVTNAGGICADDQHVWLDQNYCDESQMTPKVKRHIDLKSEDGRALIRLLAAYLAEGDIATEETADTQVGADVAGEQIEWIDSLQEDYKRLFDNVTGSVIKAGADRERGMEHQQNGGKLVHKNTTYNLQMMNELAAVFFREFTGQNSQGKRIPAFVFHSSQREQDLFLNTLIGDERSQGLVRGLDIHTERTYNFETTSRELVGGVAMLLTQRGKEYTLEYRPEEESYVVRTSDSYQQDHEPVYSDVEHEGYVYDLSVAENENFVDAVGGIVLHNTDSVMLELGTDVSAEEAIEQSFEIEEQINDAYDEFARERLNAQSHRFQIEFEKLYRRFFQAGKKKRYAGHIIWKEGKEVDDIDITGFEYQRSDIAPITKEVQKKVLEMIVTGEDPERIKEYVHEIIQDVESGNIDPGEIAIPGGIGKRLDNYETDTAQVRGAKYANRFLGTNFGRGSKPKRVYLQSVHAEFFRQLENNEGFDPQNDGLYREFKQDPDVICFEYADQLPEEFEIDWEKMVEKTLKGPIARILEALDITWEEVKSGQEQTGLGQFM